MVLFQNCVQQSRSPTKMAATVQLRCYWNQLWSRWAITCSWEPLVFVCLESLSVHLLLHFKWEFFKTLHVCLLLYEDMHIITVVWQGLSWLWSYGSWIYNYLCNQCLSPLTLWVRTPLRWGVLNTTSGDKVCWWLVAVCWFSTGTLISSVNIELTATV